MVTFVHEEVTARVIIKPGSNGLYNIETDNTNWDTVDHLILDDERVNVIEDAIAYNITFGLASSMANGLIAVLKFNGEPNLDKHAN